MSVYNYDIVSKIVDRNKPFFYKSRNSLICRFNKGYIYYLEASRFNVNTQDTDYFLLLSKTKFDENCRLINNDAYGRAIIALHGHLLNYIVKESKERVNFNVKYLETVDNYDVYSVE